MITYTLEPWSSWRGLIRADGVVVAMLAREQEPKRRDHQQRGPATDGRWRVMPARVSNGKAGAICPDESAAEFLDVLPTASIEEAADDAAGWLHARVAA